MPTTREKWHTFERGLWLVGGKEQTNQAWLRRNRGINILRTPSIRSRLGSTLLYSLNAHSLFRYDLTRFQGVGTMLYRAGVSIITGLNGNRLTFSRMPPQAGLFDYLFVAGGGTVQKVDAAGSVTNWGIAAPTSDFSTSVGGVGILNATYTYWVTFKNLSTGSRSNAGLTATGVTAAPANQQVTLSSIPTSTDPQVTAREVYRSVANGAVGFLLTTINDNTTTSYVDNAADSTLGTQQLQLDNVPPASTYQDSWGPWDGAMWWGRDSASGKQGRVYFSPKARPESVSSFIDITNPDDPTQKGLIWNGNNYVMTNKKLIQITGSDGVYSYTVIAGVPGTVNPFTVKATPWGIAYEALDGVRLWNGVQSVLLGADQIGPLFRGESAENLTAFTGVVAEFSRDEYIISDGTQTLAYHFPSSEWRDLGLGINAFYQEEDTRHLQASFNSGVYSLEDWVTVKDGSATITFEVEISAYLPAIDMNSVLQRLYLDINTNGQILSGTLIYDNTTQVLPNVVTNGRQPLEWSINQNVRLFSLRLTGNLTAAVEVFGVEADVYTAQPMTDVADLRNQLSQLYEDQQRAR